jgi:KAP family P-loop domain
MTSSTTTAPMPLWDDNPSIEDFLGFDAVIAPILAALATPEVDPLTIGIQSPWGGGKSTVLELLDAQLGDDRRYLVIRTDPWQYDNHDDVRGVLIVEILDAIRTHFDGNADVKKRIGELLGRVSWSRVGAVVGKGLLTMQWNPAQLVKAFTPEQRSSPKSMSGFKDAFAKLLKDLPDLDRVVVLVDDLDRCLPAAVMATLEAIKLFLAVPKTVFVIAADQDMVRDAIAANLTASSRKDTFAGRYLEKIVQLPISLPRLAPADAEAYIGLLLAKREATDPAAFATVVAHAAARRADGQQPLLAGWDDDGWRPSEETLTLAAQLSQGLSADRFANPRQIKRFLNAYGVRATIAEARGVPLPAALLIKMLLLEDQHRPAFETLAATPVSQRRTLLTAWEAWGRGEADQPPTGIADTTRDWAGAAPYLAREDIAGYLTLAATLLNVHAGGLVSDEIIALIDGMLGSSDSVRDANITEGCKLDDTEQADALDLLFTQGRQLEDPNAMFVAAIRWARGNPAVAPAVVQAIRDAWSRLTLAAVAELSGSGIPELTALVPDILTDTNLPGDVVEAARIELEQ